MALNHSITAAVVAPVRLQGAYSVLLQAVPGIKLIARTATVLQLLSLEIEQSPDLVLLEADSDNERASDQIRQLKAAWPTTCCIVLVEDSRQRKLVEQERADVVLLKGVSPRRLLETINQLCSAK